MRVLSTFEPQRLGGTWMRRLVLGGVMVLLACASGEAQQPSLIGTWQTTINWDSLSGLLITLVVGAGGQLNERVDNHQGQAYLLAGSYTFDPQSGDFRYTWTDYQPKQLCSITNICQPMPVPPVQFNMPIDGHVAFGSANFFTGTSSAGTLQWGRVQ